MAQQTELDSWRRAILKDVFSPESEAVAKAGYEALREEIYGPGSVWPQPRSEKSQVQSELDAQRKAVIAELFSPESDAAARADYEALREEIDGPGSIWPRRQPAP